MDLTTLAMIKKFMNEKPATPQPTGTIEITENGTGIDVAQYAFADVAVPNPSTGTLSITENGENIDVTEYAAVDVAVSGGASFGTLQGHPYEESTKPTVGATPSFTKIAISQLWLGDAELVSFSDNSGLNTMAAGFYIKAGPYYDVDTVDAYVCDLAYGPTGAPTYKTVTPWDGQIDDLGDGGSLRFGFTMPDFGEVGAPKLIFHIYKK